MGEARIAVHGLLGALEDTDRFVRKIAAEAIGKLGPSSDRVLAALGRATKDPDAAIKSAAKHALRMVIMRGVPPL